MNSSNYPANYDDDEYCTWQIQVPVNKKIRLDFKEFKTESGKDYLMIYDTSVLYFQLRQSFLSVLSDEMKKITSFFKPNEGE